MKLINETGLLFALLFPFAAFSTSNAIASNADTIRVGKAQEFIDAIGSNRVIELAADSFFLDDITIENATSPNSVFLKDGVHISGVTNLEILGNGTKKQPTVLALRKNQNTVLSFDECTDIRLVNVEVHQLSNEGTKEAGFLSFDKSQGITIINCMLSGSASFGVNLSEVKNLKVKKTTISKSRSAMMILKASSDLLFEECSFASNKSRGHLIMAESCQAVQFVKCSFEKNYPDKSSPDYKQENDFIFLINKENPGAGFILNKCTFPGNKIKKLTNTPKLFTLKETQF